MAYKQLKPFYPNDMGKRKGWCLENVARGFHIYGVPSGLPSAKADMEFNRAHGTLHPLSTIPNYVSVPVYLDTASKYEHVEVCDKGTYWSDGYVVAKPTNSFGWGEYCNGVRIVEWKNDPQPTGFLPPKGYWCRYDNDNRVAQLAQFMRSTFPAYTPAAALGPVYGDNLWRSIKEFQRRTGLEQDGNTGPKTYAKLKEYGFKG
jgi:peptidoglycan hydrolase-like protein with peptidoglycan-binding domain